MLRQFIRTGDTAIDATCGNGNDTLLLAEIVGVSGRVWAFDIQSEAIAETARKLSEAGYLDRVKLVQSGHENMAQVVRGNVNGIIFNLGYLPGGDHTIVTCAGTTVTAMEQSLKLLTGRGVLAITVYPGHTGGEIEQRAVTDWATVCDPKAFHVWRMGQLNVAPGAPHFIMIQKVN